MPNGINLNNRCAGNGNHKKGIVFMDLDGTILDNKLNLIPESTLLSIRLLKCSGYITVLSTGRDMDTHYSVRYKAMIEPDAIIHHNGNKITVGNELIYEHFMDEELVRKIYTFCKDRGYCIGTSIDKEDFFLNPEVKYKADKSYKKVVERNFVPFEEIFKRHLRITALSYAGDIANEKPIIEKAFPMIKLFPFSKGLGADLVEIGSSKAEGMKRICEYYGIDVKNTYAFGDSHNDIPLLKAAYIGVAMGNADEEAKQAADYVTDDIRHDGVYKACLHFGLIDKS